MLRALLCLALFCLSLFCLSPGCSAQTPAAKTLPPELTVAVADFAGADKDLGRFLADTLLTDLAQSPRLRMVERSEIRQALGELKLQATGLVEPQQVKQVGKLLGADRLVVGSYLVRDGQLLVNARLLDVHTGRVTPGGAANATGDPGNVLPLIHRLAGLLHQRVTGEALPQDSDSAQSAPPLPDENPADRPSSDTTPLSDLNTDDSGAPSHPRVSAPADRSDGYHVSQPGGRGTSRSALPPADGNRYISVRDLQTMLPAYGGSTNVGFFTSGRAAGEPISRLRALLIIARATTALVPSRSRSRSALSLPDAARLPIWSLSAVSAAIDRGLWPAGHALHGSQTATRAFVRVLLSRLPPARSRRVLARSHATPARVVQARYDTGQSSVPPVVERTIYPQERAVGYTGLIVEARGFPVQRTMSARIVDENGRAVYPDVHHLPSIDYIEDHGMADYLHDPEQATRAGTRPFVVQAIGAQGDDIMVSAEAGDRILELSQRENFLRHWSVCVLLDVGR